MVIFSQKRQCQGSRKQTYTDDQVGCVCCHLAASIDPTLASWSSKSVKNMKQIVSHRNSDACKRSRATVAAHFRTKKVTACNKLLNETENTEIEIPILPFERYQTELVSESRGKSNHFKVIQVHTNIGTG